MLDKSKIRPYCIFKDVMHCFIAACGLALLELFFGRINEVITKNLIINLVNTNFFCLLTVYIIYKCLFHLEKDPVFTGINKLPDVVAHNSLKKKDDNSKKILEVISIHEAGHVVMAYLQNIEIVKCVTNAENGYTITKAIQGTMNAKEYEKLILIDYAGAVSEKLIFNEFKAGSIGKNSDFEHAEQKIKNLLILNNDINGYTTGGEHFDKLVREKSIVLYNKAYEIIKEHKDSILKIANVLKKEQTISGERVYEYMKEYGN